MDGTRDAEADGRHRHLPGVRSRTAESGRNNIDRDSNNILERIMESLIILGVTLHKDRWIRISK